MARLHSKLFGDGEDDRKPREGGKSHKTVSDDEEKKTRKIDRAIGDGCNLDFEKSSWPGLDGGCLGREVIEGIRVRRGVGEFYARDFSKDKDKLQRSFARGTFGMVKRLESACWRTQVSLYDSKTSKNNTATNTDKGDEVTAVLELRMEKNDTTSIEFKKEELFTFFKELETIQMKIDDLS